MQVLDRPVVGGVGVGVGVEIAMGASAQLPHSLDRRRPMQETDLCPPPRRHGEGWAHILWVVHTPTPAPKGWG